MIRTSTSVFLLAALLVVMAFLHPLTSNAQSQSLSVTPPLFQVSVEPGNVWQSSLKVVNPNPYPLVVYANVANFAAVGEAGQGRFLPIEGDAADQKTLAEWIVISEGPHTIPPEQSTDIPFTISVPSNAPPGGHYAAVLISTQPADAQGGQVVYTVQSVTSLFFLRVEGDVVEDGSIREFRAVDSVVSVPDATLSLRFENKGNVHLQPRGEIIITNMWGTERGRIPVNYRSNFGNVLPQSIRDFTFNWRSDFRVTDIGRYSAHATLAYGQNGVQSKDAIAYFWVIPIKATLITLLVLILFVVSITLMVRAYVRRVLALAGVPVSGGSATTKEPVQPAQLYKRAAAPITHGVLDLRTRLRDTDVRSSRFSAIVNFVIHYKFFFLSLIAFAIIVTSIVWYVRGATTDNQNYEIEIIGESRPMPIRQ